MDWRPLPDTAAPVAPVQWVGREAGEDVAWIVEWRRWGDPGHQWQVATPYGTAFGRRRTLQEAQRSADNVLRLYAMAAE